MAITAMLIHATVEFNLQIPAYAATFMVILATAWLSRYLRSEKHPESPPNTLPSPLCPLSGCSGRRPG
jgi:hypothetical protein